MHLSEKLWHLIKLISSNRKSPHKKWGLFVLIYKIMYILLLKYRRDENGEKDKVHFNDNSVNYFYSN